MSARRRCFESQHDHEPALPRGGTPRGERAADARIQPRTRSRERVDEHLQRELRPSGGATELRAARERERDARVRARPASQPQLELERSAA